MATRLNVFQRDNRRRKRGLKLENFEGRSGITSLCGTKAIGFGRNYKLKRSRD
ncbi:MAG: hypothetical protein VKK42_02400 [Lyngbya sp.]|nr:hypothetical protein [Lyngbya sp.]